jgi:hypothetical protein
MKIILVLLFAQLVLSQFPIEKVYYKPQCQEPYVTGIYVMQKTHNFSFLQMSVTTLVPIISDSLAIQQIYFNLVVLILSVKIVNYRGQDLFPIVSLSDLCPDKTIVILKNQKSPTLVSMQKLGTHVLYM